MVILFFNTLQLKIEYMKTRFFKLTLAFFWVIAICGSANTENLENEQNIASP